MKSTDLIDQDSLRTDIPDFGPGDEVEGARPGRRGQPRARAGLPGQRHRPLRARACRRPSRSARSATRSASSAPSRSTRRSSPSSRSSSSGATCAGPSSTTCVTARGRRPDPREARATDRGAPGPPVGWPSVSTEDLENFEAERELQLAQEYQDVVRHVPLRGRDRAALLPGQRGERPTWSTTAHGPLVEVELKRRLGVGHVPPQPVRAERAGAQLQGRQRRGAAPSRSCELTGRAARPPGAWGEAQVARWYEARGLRGAGPQLARAARASSTWSWPGRRWSCSAR